MIRNYPIRFNRNSWKIKFYTYHQCDERCRFTVIPSGESPILYVLSPNPRYNNGKCSRMNELERASIYLCDFDKDNPQSIYGKLEKSDEIVVPDTTISVIINYPILNCTETIITSQDPRGFSLKELLYQIKKIYQYIYIEEERTAQPYTYHLSKFCERCISRESKYECVQTLENPPEEECSICYNDFHDEECGQLKCNHVFHRRCIQEWLDYSSNCPLCRLNTTNCQECNGTYIVYYDYTGVVIPHEHRGIMMMRNMTNGTFGIDTFDFEDLIIKSLDYDRKRKQLRIEFVNN